MDDICGIYHKKYLIIFVYEIIKYRVQMLFCNKYDK